jgi:hypothetical protein
MGSEIPPSLREIAHFQGGIVTRKQALSEGLASGVIISKIRYRRWRQVYHGVYAMFTGPLSRTAQLWAAVLYAGIGAELSHETAAESHGITDRSELIHISIPSDRRVQPAPGMQIHISVRAGASCSQPYVLPRTSVEDTILDLVEAAKSLDDVREWVTAGRRVIGEWALRAAAGKRKKMRWRRQFDEILAGAADVPTQFGLAKSGLVPPASAPFASTLPASILPGSALPGRALP